MKRGYYIVDPGSALAAGELSSDTQTRCLSYVVKHLGEIAHLPPEVEFQVIPLRWHHHGEPYPTIGMYPVSAYAAAGDLTGLSFALGERVSAFISEVGLERLQALASQEAVTWADIQKAEDAQAEPPSA